MHTFSEESQLKKSELSKPSLRNGFTLIELIVVVAVLGILAAILVPTIIGFINSARKNTCLTTIQTSERVDDIYVAEGGTFRPDGTGNFQFLIDAKLLGNAPVCPAGGTYSWVRSTQGLLNLICSVHGSEFSILGVNIAFTSTFDSLSGVKVLRGDFRTRDGYLYNILAGENRALFDGSSGTDCSVNVNAKLVNPGAAGSSGYGVYFRATASPTDKTVISGYCFQIDPGAGDKFIVRKVVNNNESVILSKTSFPKGFDLYAAHDIQIDSVGSKQVVKVDGVVVASFTDSSFTQGSVGVRTWNTTVAQFNDVTVSISK
jgi:prepilin-type N-terminal cleavage/methylation domain-containing protein